MDIKTKKRKPLVFFPKHITGLSEEELSRRFKEDMEGGSRYRGIISFKEDARTRVGDEKERLKVVKEIQDMGIVPKGMFYETWLGTLGSAYLLKAISIQLKKKYGVNAGKFVGKTLGGISNEKIQSILLRSRAPFQYWDYAKTFLIIDKAVEIGKEKETKEVLKEMLKSNKFVTPKTVGEKLKIHPQVAEFLLAIKAQNNELKARQLKSGEIKFYLPENFPKSLSAREKWTPEYIKGLKKKK